jgi:hypothetical protein
MTDSSSSEEESVEEHITSLAAELLQTHQALEIEKNKEGGTYILHIGQVHIEIPHSNEIEGDSVMEYFEKTLKNLHRLYGPIIFQGHHNHAPDEEGTMFG